MKATKKSFLENTSINTKLVNNILKQCGVSFRDFAENVDFYRNVQNGVSGFIYYYDTHEFAIKNQSLIIESLEEQADQLGEDVLTMVSNFGIFRGDKMDKQDKKDLYNFLGGNKKTEQGTVTNVLAWYAVEHLAYEVDNFIND